MPAAPIPPDEQDRLAALRSYAILDTLGEQAYDDITALASMICGTPIAAVSLIDTDRQWFKSIVGLDVSETPRDVAFCAHAILDPESLLVVPDATRDARFTDNALVVGDPGIRFYAGAPLTTADDMTLGTLCVIDRVPRELNAQQLEALSRLSRQLGAQLELRRNVKNLSEATTQLESANRELDDFAYVTSHDLKEPLRGMSGHAELLLEDYAAELDEAGKNRLQSLIGLAGHLSELIDSLLKYCRAGRFDLQRKSVPIESLVERVLSSLEFVLEEEGIEVRWGAEPLPEIECDAVATAEVFSNLISNAMKYSDARDKWIEIGCVTDPESAETRFYVRDNGIGISAAHQKKIFGIFQRLHSPGAFGGGTGAGLCIVERLVERHSGRIWVESTPGEGSTFWFTLAPPAPIEEGPNSFGATPEVMEHDPQV